MIYEIDLLSEQQLNFITQKYKPEFFVDGSLSNPSTKKKNLMMSSNFEYEILNKICSDIVYNNSELFSIYMLKRMSPTYFLWYKKGMRYDYHIDTNPIGGVNSHYSMTCFLNDPSEYDGGELVLKIGNKEIEYKLAKGKAVIYSTGLPHKVNPVISGDRKAFVCWIETAIQQSFIRNHLIDYGNYINSLNLDDDVIENLEQFRINLMREYAQF